MRRRPATHREHAGRNAASESIEDLCEAGTPTRFVAYALGPRGSTSISRRFLTALRHSSWNPPQVVREFTVADEERRESAFFHKRMVQREHNRVIVHHVKGMTEFPRVADAGHLSQVMPVSLEELDEMSCAPVGEAEDHAMLDAVLGHVLGDAPEDRESVPARTRTRLPPLDADP
jgi:hypothetical protein